MKKQYTAPEVYIVNVKLAGIICTSVGFGEGTTSIMHARGRDDFDADADL